MIWVRLLTDLIGAENQFSRRQLGSCDQKKQQLVRATYPTEYAAGTTLRRKLNIIRLSDYAAVRENRTRRNRTIQIST